MKRGIVDESPSRRRRIKSGKSELSPVSRQITEADSEDDNDSVTSSDEIGPSSVQKYVEQLSQGMGLVTPKSTKKRKNPRKDSETSSEEERWLDAIQSGKLEEVDEELRKVKSKDPKMMTARQRAMMERKSDKEGQGDVADTPEASVAAILEIAEPLLALPSGYKEAVMTEEAIQRKALKSLKRKEKADEKREKDMKRTMERLLKKQDTKSVKGNTKKTGRRSGPCISYIDNKSGPQIIVPLDIDYFKPKQTPVSPVIKLCQAPDCSKPKKYSCKKTGVPLCSFECYKRNIDQKIRQAFS